MDLKDKVVLITGASTGIGKAMAEKFAEHKANVAIVARDGVQLQKVAKSIGKRAFAVEGDVRDSESVKEFVGKTLKKFGKIDILINNAGIGGPYMPFYKVKEEDFDRVMETNLKGAFLVSKEVVPAMIKRKQGRIINVSSVAGKKASGNFAPYCASKFALNGFTEALAIGLKKYNIHVHLICPGPVNTPFMSKLDVGNFSTFKKKLHSMIRNKKHYLKAEDVAEVAIYLAKLPKNVEVFDITMWPSKYF